MLTFGYMNRGRNGIILFACISTMMLSCDRNDDEMPDHRYGYIGSITYNLRIDSIQDRLDSNANQSVIPPGHGSLSPTFNLLHVTQIKLLTSDSGSISTLSQPEAITAEQETLEGNFHYNGTPVTFNFLQVSFSFQNFDVACSLGGSQTNVSVLSFLCLYYYPYTSFIIHDSIVPHPIHNRGEWFLEIDSIGMGAVLHGQTSIITAPNYLQSDNGQDYVLTCPINPPITFKKDQHHTLTVSISSNHSFEWIEHSDPAFFEPLDGDTIYDFGLRGAMVTY